jgi:hypothetical protein
MYAPTIVTSVARVVIMVNYLPVQPVVSVIRVPMSALPIIFIVAVVKKQDIKTNHPQPFNAFRRHSNQQINRRTFPGYILSRL